MQPHRIELPKDLSAESISTFACKLHSTPAAERYVVDFGPQRWFPPFSMALLSLHLRRFRGDRAEAECIAENYENHSYAAHMGFFQAFGLDHGKKPGEASGSSTYVPIQHLEATDLHAEAAGKMVPVGAVIEMRAGELATMLTRKKTGALHDTLTFSIKEIMRNVVEHSEATSVTVCAQYWPHLRKVEVGIADAGRGIRAGLADNPKFEFDNDRDAIQAALLPGVSGNIAAGKGQDPWQNSGYGLYMTSRICRAGGSFLICSGSSGIALEGDKKINIASDLHGTAVRLLINTAKLGQLDQRLATFRAEGVAAAKHIRGAIKVDPSSASQMLSRDFRDIFS